MIGVTVPRMIALTMPRMIALTMPRMIAVTMPGMIAVTMPGMVVGAVAALAAADHDNGRRRWVDRLRKRLRRRRSLHLGLRRFQRAAELGVLALEIIGPAALRELRCRGLARELGLLLA